MEALDWGSSLSKIAHIVNLFDPACDVLRCVRELNLYSKHSHKLFIRDVHPLQSTYQYEQHHNEEDAQTLLNWCDAILYQFVGWEGGPDDTNKPAAFRNINIRWDAATNKFWCEAQYNAQSTERYKLFSSSHVGAAEFLPADLFRWLPDLIPLDGIYTPGAQNKSPRVSYIKHATDFAQLGFDCPASNHLGRAHADIMRDRRELVTVAVDNVSDGHMGLSGLETMAMGIPTVVFNHHKTRAALEELSPGDYPPFLECSPDVKQARETVNLNQNNVVVGLASRAWMEKWYHPKRIVQTYWDVFFDELIKEN